MAVLCKSAPPHFLHCGARHIWQKKQLWCGPWLPRCPQTFLPCAPCAEMPASSLGWFLPFHLSTTDPGCALPTGAALFAFWAFQWLTLVSHQGSSVFSRRRRSFAQDLAVRLEGHCGAEGNGCDYRLLCTFRLFSVAMRTRVCRGAMRGLSR